MTISSANIILSQGAIYQYVMGFQGAARDPLQHSLPFLFSDPGIVKRSAPQLTQNRVLPNFEVPL
jgi:hypothetical protein